MRENACVDFDLADPDEAARALNTCTGSLQRWRSQRRGPAYVKIGGKVFYPRARLAEYVRAHTNLYETI